MYRFNKYSWILIIIYLAVLTTMEYFSYRTSMDFIYRSFPLIAVFIFWSEKTTRVFQKTDSSLTRTDRFKIDFFLISYSFISGYLLSLLFQYNNSDAHGWWSLVIYFVSAFGVLLAFVFSIIAMMLNNHKKYTVIYSLVLVLILLFLSLMMHLNPFSFFAKSETFYSIFLLLTGVHLLLCIGYKAVYGKLFN